MIFAIVLLVVGAALAVAGFNLMKPKSGDIPVGGGAYVNAGPEERSAAAKEAGPWVPSTCAGDLRGLLMVALRSQGNWR